MMHHNQSLPKVAYFCMEYGIDNELPIYAGGLGILAGDHLKSANDIKVPLIGIGILWRNDYTTQLIGADGRPYDNYPEYDFPTVKDTGKTVQVRVRGMDVTCKIMMVDVYGNAPLYLLSANFEGSEHGWMTSKLYGGVAQDRVAQEIILGVGGIRALRTLGIDIDVYHFNEGHAVFAGLELIQEKMNAGLSFHDAWQKTREEIVFTTHTPVEAGNEVHSHELLQLMEAYNGLTYEQMREVGGDPFNMTVAALRTSRIANGVSKLHGRTARKMWRSVADSAEIISITNGVHPPTWQHSSIRTAWKKGENLWEPHIELKKKLLDYVKEQTGANMDLDKLTISFARRAAPYKRSELIFRDTNALDSLLKEGKLQLIFSGKAHPNDTLGKDIIQTLVQMDRKYKDSIVFLENYNMDIAKLMVQGSDAWLNNPIRPLEASGTSGMKAAMNGVLNISVIDGWVAEGPHHKVDSWLLDEAFHYDVDYNAQDEHDLRALYKVIHEEAVPVYYNNRNRWIKMMKASISMSHHNFSSDRMVKQYYDLLYTGHSSGEEWMPKFRQIRDNWQADHSHISDFEQQHQH